MLQVWTKFTLVQIRYNKGCVDKSHKIAIYESILKLKQPKRRERDGFHHSFQVQCHGRKEAFLGNTRDAPFSNMLQTMFSLENRKAAFDPNLPEPHHCKIFFTSNTAMSPKEGRIAATCQYSAANICCAQTI